MLSRRAKTVSSSTPVFLTLLLTFFSVPPVLVQGQAPAEAAKSTPTIVTSVEEVTLDLVVRDKKDKPVLDLQPVDLAVTDNGSLVKLSGLRLVNGQSGTEHPVVMVFDQLDPASAKNAREITAKILKQLPDAKFSFAVLKIDGRLRLFQPFTSDRTAVNNAVAAVTKKSPSGDDGAVFVEKNLVAIAQTGADTGGSTVSVSDRTSARNLLAALRESQRILQDQHAQPAFAGLLALARSARDVPGRKVIFYFSQGLKADSRANDILENITGTANRAGVSIYTIDTNMMSEQVSQGLMATAAMGGAMSQATMNPAPALTALPQGMANITPAGMQTSAGDQMSRFEHGGAGGHADPMTEIAVTTGGAYIGSGENLKKPLQRLVEDMTTYYEASYAPAIENYDGSFRPVVVRPTRKGLKVRSRAGYFALAPGSESGIRPFEAPLLKMLADTEPAADLKFRSQVLQLGDLPDGSANVLAVEVPLSSLELQEDPNTNLFSTHVSIVAQIKNKTGTVIEHFSEDVPQHGSLEAVGSAQAEVITLQRHFTAKPGEYVMEAAVLDRNSGKGGTQRVNFEIPGAPPGPSLGEIALVRSTEPFKGDADPSEPMRYENGRVIPNISSNIARGAKSISVFFLIHPDPGIAEQAQLEMEVARNGSVVGHMPLQLRKINDDGVIPYLASIKSDSLPGGNYEVRATLTQGGKTSARNISFRVEGAELASATPAKNDTPSPASETVASDANPEVSGMEPSNGHHVVIAALPLTTAAPPDASELQAIITDARNRAVSYSTSLPNFLCVEVTDRSVDPLGSGTWRHKDSIAELLRYHDNEETRTMLAINGKKSSTDRADLKGTLSHGEFGGVLKAIFDPAAKAEFQWKETDALDGSTVQVLSYKVAQKNSSFGLTGDNNYQVSTGFHGLVYVDSATRGVRRLTLEADDLPADFSIHAASILVDYDYIAIGSHDYLMPVSGTISMQQHKHEAVLNQVAFRNYRRYGSKMRMVLADTPKK